MRLFLAMAIHVSAVGAAVGQQATTFARAIPPSKDALERLNLKADWSFYAPVSGQSDGLAKVQILDEFQIAVQTKAGLLCLVDQSTGRLLWKYKYPAKFSSGFGVGVNEKFLFAVNVAKLYCFHRYTGVMEFEFDLPEAPSASPVADGSQVYISFTGAKVMAFQLPPSMQLNPDAVNKKLGVAPDNSKLPNPADVIADRYATRINPKSANDDEFDRRNVPKSYFESGQSLSTHQRSPSISAMPSVVPPYSIHGLNKVESLSMLPSLRQPYKLHPDHLVYNQYSPSLAVIPPSIARVHELSNLRPQGVKPRMAWTIGTKQKIVYDPILVESKSQITSPRVWITEASANFLSVSQSTGGTEVSGSFGSEPTGPLVGRGPADLLHYYRVGQVAHTTAAIAIFHGDAEQTHGAERLPQIHGECVAAIDVRRAGCNLLLAHLVNRIAQHIDVFAEAELQTRVSGIHRVISLISFWSLLPCSGAFPAPVHTVPARRPVRPAYRQRLCAAAAGWCGAH